MSATMVKIEVNGREIEVPSGAMLIEAADAAGIAIPRFCYHRKLSIAASCRMCLVEVEKAPKALPACATPVAEGMKVQTRSPKAIAAQRGVMEFLLINHPLDCPICDQGGECDLQDIAIGYGKDISRFAEGKRVVSDPDLGPLIATDMTRCIHCTRCVRFSAEIAGVRELGAPGRGEHMFITSWLNAQVTSELSGNVVDLCPVGALTSKPFRYRARAWELTPVAGIGGHDCIGSNLWFDTLRGQVMRVRPRDNERLNECWLTDRDRYSYTAFNHPQRLTRPLLRERDGWREVDWEEALTRSAQMLRNVVDNQGADQLAALAAPSQSCEEYYLLQKLLRGLGCDNIDHRPRQQAFSASQGAPLLGVTPEQLEVSECVVLIGANPRKEQPLVNHRLRKAVLDNGATVHQINPVDWTLRYPLDTSIIAAPDALVEALRGIAAALLATGATAPDGWAGYLTAIDPDAAQQAIAQRLHEAESPHLLLGLQAMMMPQYPALDALANTIASMCGGSCGYLSDGANSVGGWLAGAVPQHAADGVRLAAAGLDAAAMFESPRRGYVLLGIEPEFDCINPLAVRDALAGADAVVALSAFDSPMLREHADIILPLALWAESSGTFVNGCGDWQSYSAAARAPGEARPGWKVLRVLGTLLGVAGFDHDSSEQVREELQAQIPSESHNLQRQIPGEPVVTAPALQRIPCLSPYAIDAVVRRSEPLQQAAATARDVCNVCRVSTATAARLGVKAAGGRVRLREGGDSVELDLEINDDIADGCVLVVQGTETTSRLAAPFGATELELL